MPRLQAPDGLPLHPPRAWAKLSGAMDTIRDPHEYQQRALEWRAEGQTHALVPTMGALHAGHYTLIERARGLADRVSVSLFVNPRQFGPNEDLAAYPRTYDNDREGCAARGVDVMFAPTNDAMYPPGFETSVRVERLGLPLCGRSRPVHFGGVATVVMKLLMLAQPTHALFGWKDAQQLLVLRRMVHDLAVPVEVIGVETVREHDGLAMSSRNAYLGPEDRAAAPLLYLALCAARERFEAGERRAQELLGAARAVVEPSPRIRTDYLEMRSLDSLETLETAEPGNTLIAIAAYLGDARLIDNVRL